MRTRHRTVTLPGPAGPVDIDCGIAGLVTACWQAGVRTVQSCEDFHGDGYVWLAFKDIGDLLRFLDHGVPSAGEDDPESLFNRAAFGHEVLSADSTPEGPGQWRYRLMPGFDGNSWSVAPSVEFPRADVPALCAALSA